MARSNDSYSSGAFGATHQMPLMGNAGTALLITPQAGTSAATKTHTTTLLGEGFQRAIVLKKLVYAITTAQTGAGNNLDLDVYNGTTSVGSLAVTTEAALTVATSSDINSTVTAGGYIRIIAKSTTTASDANCAIGRLHATYQELFTA